MSEQRKEANPGRMDAPVLQRAALAEECAALRGQGKRIVFTNGCFDILHLGHVRYLQQAAGQGDVLVLGVNSDDSVRRLKGEKRPIVPEEERAAILAALRSVDYVTLFSEDTPAELIRAVRPDVLVKGGDYDPVADSGPRHIVGSEFVRSYGGTVRVIDFVEGRSTTNVIGAVLQAYGDPEPKANR